MKHSRRLSREKHLATCHQSSEERGFRQVARGKRESDFCLEIRFAVNTPKGEEKTMRNVPPYKSNLQEELFAQNTALPPVEGAIELDFD